MRASIEVTFAALLDQLGPYNETQVDRPMPMKLEAWPGGKMVSRPGRQQRPLLGNGAGDQEADAAGNLRATVYFQSGDNESSMSAEGIGGVTIITFRHQSFGLVLEEYRNVKNGWAHLHGLMRQRAEAPRPH